MNNILELRTQTGKTQDEFSEMCGVSRISIARYEAGAPVSRATAEKIASACGVSVSYVIGDVRPPGTKKEPAEAGHLDERFRSRAALLSPENMVKLDAYLDGLLAAQDTKSP